MRRTFCCENERHLTCLICGDVTEHLPVPDYYYFHVWSLYSASCCNVAPCARDDKIDDLFAAPPPELLCHCTNELPGHDVYGNAFTTLLSVTFLSSSHLRFYHLVFLCQLWLLSPSLSTSGNPSIFCHTKSIFFPFLFFTIVVIIAASHLCQDGFPRKGSWRLINAQEITGKFAAFGTGSNLS